MAKKSSGGTPATVALTKGGVAFTVHAYAHTDGATNFGEEAAAALGSTGIGSSRPWWSTRAGNWSWRWCRSPGSWT